MPAGETAPGDALARDFERGPIRPPSEAASLLLRVTRNCPWNRCRFCAVYKKRRFSLRPVEEVLADIDTVAAIVSETRRIPHGLGQSGAVSRAVVARMFPGGMTDACRSVVAWLRHGAGACFLQDADNLILGTDDLVRILAYLKQRLPDVRRVTTYARSRTVARKSVEALKRIREAGLDRIHIGLETGHDPLLKFIKKGVDAEGQVEAGRRVIEAGMELSEYVMPGLGGQAMWREHAVDTALAINRIHPHFIRLRSLRVPRRAPLFEEMAAGRFTPQTDDEVVAEIRLFIESLDVSAIVASDHLMNLLEGVSGKLPEDRGGMLAVIDSYLNMPGAERQIYRFGRRGGAYRDPSDLKRDPDTRERIRQTLEAIRSDHGEQGVEAAIRDLADRYV